VKHNLENIPACLRVIARQIEKGEIAADVGLLTLRKRGASRPTVFGFGPVGKIEPVRECGRAALEVLRLSTDEKHGNTNNVADDGKVIA
jgi:hypothetical protein